MTVNISKHDMNKFNTSRLNKIIARNNMPTTMPIVAFTTFTDINCCLNFQTDGFSIIAIFANEIWVLLIMIMFVR